MMSANTDRRKGQAKQAAGILTGDKQLESSGKADRRAGDIKAKVEEATDKVEEAIDKAKDSVRRK